MVARCVIVRKADQIGYHGGDVEGWRSRGVSLATIDEAVGQTYQTDAYIILTTVIGLELPPLRQTKASLGWLREQGADVLAAGMFLDVDAHDLKGPDLDAWKAAEAEKIRRVCAAMPTGYYFTRGGYRLCWKYPEPITVEAHEARLRAAAVYFERFGINVDTNAMRWGNLYRLPRVTRNGELQQHPENVVSAGVPTIPNELVASLEKLVQVERRAKIARQKERDRKLKEQKRVLPATNQAYKDPAKLLLRAYQAAGRVKGTTRDGHIIVECANIDAHNHIDNPSPTQTALIDDGKGGHRHRCYRSTCKFLPPWFFLELLGFEREARPEVRAQTARRVGPPPPTVQSTAVCSPAVGGVNSSDSKDVSPPLETEGVKLPAVRRTPIAELRAELGTELDAALRDGGDHVFRVGTGIGKTYEALRAVGRAGISASIPAPTREQRDEIAARAHKVPELSGHNIVTFLGREPSNCKQYHVVGEIQRAGGRKAMSRYCDEECFYRDGCPFFGQFTRVRYTETGTPTLALMTHALAAQAGEDVLPDVNQWIVDESPVRAIRSTVAVTAGQLDRLRAVGAVEMSDETRGQLGSVMGQGRGSSVSLAAVTGAIDLAATRKHTDAVVEAVKRGESLADYADHRAAEALARAASSGWRGAFVHGGDLCLPVPDVELPQARGRIVLDATASEEMAALVLPGCTHHDLGGAPVPNVECYRYHVSADKRSILRRPELSAAAYLEHIGPEVLALTHKAIVEDPEAYYPGPLNWVRRMLEAGGDVDYMGSPRQEATNRYQKKTTIIVPTYRVPRFAIVGLAELMAAAGGEEECIAGAGGRWEHYYEAARYQLEIAPVLQYIGRLRAVNRLSEKLTVILLHPDDIAGDNLPDHVIDLCISGPLWRQFGVAYCRGLGAGAVQQAIRDISEKLREPWPLEDIDRLADELGVRPPRVDVEQGRRPLAEGTLLQRLVHVLGDRRRDWPGALEELALLDHAIGGGRAVSVRLTRRQCGERYRTLVVPPGCDVVDATLAEARRFGADFADVREHDGGWVAYVVGPKWQRAAETIERRGEELTPEALAAELGCSERAVYRLLERLAIAPELLRSRGSAVLRPLRDEGRRERGAVLPWYPTVPRYPVEAVRRVRVARGPPEARPDREGSSPA